jgi:hypothetical protein
MVLPALVAPLSQFLERQKYVEEIFLEPLDLSLGRGVITEIVGSPSSGKNSFVLSVLANLTKTGEICAVVDPQGGFNPIAAYQSGVVLDNLLWVKGDNSIEKAFKSASLLAQAKGFGAIWLNLNSIESGNLRKIPTTYWYRFRNLIKETPTIFLVTAPEVMVGSATSRSFLLTRQESRWSGKGKFKLLREFRLKLNSSKLPVEPKGFNFEFCYEDL